MAMNRAPYVIEYADSELRDNYNYMLPIVSEHGSAITYVGSNLCKNREIIKTALKNSGFLLGSIDSPFGS